MNRNDILDVLREFKRAHAEQYGILEIGVFGSFARDKARDDSDIDICSQTQTPNPFVLVHIKEALEALVHRQVDIVRVREKTNRFLKERIEKEAHYV